MEKLVHSKISKLSSDHLVVRHEGDDLCISIGDMYLAIPKGYIADNAPEFANLQLIIGDILKELGK